MEEELDDLAYEMNADGNDRIRLDEFVAAMVSTSSWETLGGLSTRT
jgi:Ca2+-binding EF-hand superfamily protein